MSTELTVRQNILIQAPVGRVWEVLVQPHYIKQWDELPDGLDEGVPLQEGSELVWMHPSGHRTTLKVISFREGKELRLSLHDSTWTVQLKPEDVAYTYTLSEQNTATGLAITIGDFSKLPNGDKYHEASLEFATKAAQKIKALAEASHSSSHTPTHTPNP
jgi:uncharacterized protein YndB with AHSA1/START domain